MKRLPRSGGPLAAALFAASLSACAGPPGTPDPNADPHAGLPVSAASDSSHRRMLEHRYDEAIGYLAHIERAGGGTSADFEGAYATALGDAAFQTREVAGVPIPVTRSAVERVARMREAFAREDEGLRRADRPAQRRNLTVVRAGQLHNWGFVRESYQMFWKAHDFQPLDDAAASEALGLEQLLADPMHGFPDPSRARGAAGRP